MVVEYHIGREALEKRVTSTVRSQGSRTSPHSQGARFRTTDGGEVEGTPGGAPGIRPQGDEWVRPLPSRVLKEGRPFLCGSDENLVFLDWAAFVAHMVCKPEGRIAYLGFALRPNKLGPLFDFACA